ncbi:MAG: hypothetical protein BWY59_00673 [Verrucomicrobia bacterium ADurb.Bin345]|nr:MAG: hypothetical protein BWY59_00673 [Verrucomicrobia bacterium ADurb.Bin345]
MPQLPVLRVELVLFCQQSHLHADPPVQRLRIRHREHRRPAPPKPAPGYLEHRHRIIHVLEDMIAQQHVEFRGRNIILEERFHDLVTDPRVRELFDDGPGPFDNDEPVERRPQPRGHVPVAQPHLQRVTTAETAQRQFHREGIDVVLVLLPLRRCICSRRRIQPALLFGPVRRHTVAPSFFANSPGTCATPPSSRSGCRSANTFASRTPLETAQM